MQGCDEVDWRMACSPGGGGAGDTWVGLKITRQVDRDGGLGREETDTCRCSINQEPTNE